MKKIIIVLSLLLVSTGVRADALTDARTLVDILKGGTADNAQIQRIAGHFKTYAGDQFVAVDVANPTNEELAQNILTMFRRFGQSVVRGIAEREVNIANEGAATAAGDAAEADM